MWQVYISVYELDHYLQIFWMSTEILALLHMYIHSVHTTQAGSLRSTGDQASCPDNERKRKALKFLHAAFVFLYRFGILVLSVYILLSDSSLGRKTLRIVSFAKKN